MHTSNFANLLNTVNKMDNGFKGDDSFWKLDIDKAGNGQAIIRFLPEREGSVPFVRSYNHGFKGPSGKWFIEPCPTTIEQECYVCSQNSILWNKGTEEAKAIVRDRKRKLSYIANIYIVSDPKNPSNEGKVFKYKFGKKIFDMIVDKIKPAFEDMSPLNPFCPYTGANFRLRTHKADGWISYDKSTFDNPAPLGDDAKITGILSNMHDIEADIAPEKFKSNDDLKKRFLAAISIPQDDEFESPPVARAPITPPVPPAPVVNEKKFAPPPVVKEDDDDEAYFARLAA